MKILLSSPPPPPFPASRAKVSRGRTKNGQQNGNLHPESKWNRQTTSQNWGKMGTAIFSSKHIFAILKTKFCAGVCSATDHPGSTQVLKKKIKGLNKKKRSNPEKRSKYRWSHSTLSHLWNFPRGSDLAGRFPVVKSFHEIFTKSEKFPVGSPVLGDFRFWKIFPLENRGDLSEWENFPSSSPRENFPDFVKVFHSGKFSHLEESFTRLWKFHKGDKVEWDQQ